MFLKSKTKNLLLLFFIIIISSGMIYACSEGKTNNTMRSLELKDFDFLRKGMTAKDLEAKVGKPDVIDESSPDFILIKYFLKNSSTLMFFLEINTREIIHAYLEKPNGEIDYYLIKREKPLELSDFGFLKKGITYREVVEKVGRSDAPAGSGVFMVKYILKDGSELVLNFGASGLRLVRATLYKPNGKRVIIIE